MATFIKAGFWEKRKQGYDHWLDLEKFVSNLIPPAGGVTSITAGTGITVSGATGNVTICNTQCASPFTLNGTNFGIKPINGFNTSSAYFGVVGGGSYNSICLFANQATISGGTRNSICINSYYSTIGGGRGNVINSVSSTIGGGGGYSSSYPYIGNLGNIICGSGWSTIGGGACNQIGADKATIGGGFRNFVNSCGFGATIGGGIYNLATGFGSFVGGGKGACVYSPYGYTSSANNWASGSFSTVVGGSVSTQGSPFGNYFCRQIASGEASFIGGGKGNVSAGFTSSVVGGIRNTVNGTGSVITGGGNYTYGTYLSAIGNLLTGNQSFIGSGINNQINGNYNFIGTGGDIYAQINCISGSRSFIGTGLNIKIYGGSENFIGAGNGNKTYSNASFSFIGTGNTNTICTSIYSSILNGAYNIIDTLDCTNIIGSNITANRACTTFVNNLSIMNVPTSSAGLPTKAVWSDACVLKIV